MRALQFVAPGPGTWELEAAHHTRPMTRLVSDLVPHPMASGFAEGTALYGLVLSHLRSAFVNGFWYCKKVYAGEAEDTGEPLSADFFERPQVKARMRACFEAFDSRAWLRDLKHWDEQVKPDSIRRNRSLQQVDIVRLNDEGLAVHIRDCADQLTEMIRRHHRFTASAMVPIGHFLANASAWTGTDTGELMGLLRGASPISRGPIRELAALAIAMRRADIGEDIFERPGEEVIHTLRGRGGEVGQALAVYLEIVGNSIVSGYDVSAPRGIEVPSLLTGAIRAALNGVLSTESRRAASDWDAALLNQTAPPQRGALESMLGDARAVYRLREERTVYTDQWALGLVRRAMLEAGRRLTAQGRFAQSEQLIDASRDELIALLAGFGSPSGDELQERARHRLGHTVDEAPPWLGLAPSPPPPFEAVPEPGRPGVVAMTIAMQEIFASCDGETRQGVLSGFGASAGVYVGPVCIIESERDLERLRPGEVIVTRAASAAFSIVMPIVGALVTDRGGRLSHPAIIAREYGVPGVVGTGRATSLFHDGDVVRVDGAAGTVERIR